jgi:hypothetical protein
MFKNVKLKIYRTIILPYSAKVKFPPRWLNKSRSKKKYCQNLKNLLKFIEVIFPKMTLILRKNGKIYRIL